MKSTARLYQCMFCHKQVTICRKCDRGNIYCADGCAAIARTRSLKLAKARYQVTLKGRHHNAAHQARFRMSHKKIVRYQGSPPSPRYDLMKSLENQPRKPENDHKSAALICCFCKKSVSVWFRNDFLRRRERKKSTELRAYPQAP